MGFDPMKEENKVLTLSGKRVIVIGERDGVPGPAIEHCLITAGATILKVVTECFV